MEPLDLSLRPPRSCYEEFDGLILIPRTIDKVRASLPGGNPGVYFINGKIPGISGYLLSRLGIGEGELTDAIANAATEDEVHAWIRARTDPTQYAGLSETFRRVKMKHAEDPAYLAELYAETLALHPDLVNLVDIIDADDRRMFGENV